MRVWLTEVISLIRRIKIAEPGRQKHGWRERAAGEFYHLHHGHRLRIRTPLIANAKLIQVSGTGALVALDRSTESTVRRSERTAHARETLKTRYSLRHCAFGRQSGITHSGKVTS